MMPNFMLQRGPNLTFQFLFRAANALDIFLKQKNYIWGNKDHECGALRLWHAVVQTKQHSAEPSLLLPCRLLFHYHFNVIELGTKFWRERVDSSLDQFPESIFGDAHKKVSSLECRVLGL